MQALRLPPSNLYQARHSGASSDSAGGRRTLKKVKRRGRWRSDASLRRYEKAERLTDQLRRLDPQQQSAALAAWDALPRLLWERRPASIRK